MLAPGVKQLVKMLAAFVNGYKAAQSQFGGLIRQRIKVIVIDAAINHIDALGSRVVRMYNGIVADLKCRKMRERTRYIF